MTRLHERIDGVQRQLTDLTKATHDENEAMAKRIGGLTRALWTLVAILFTGTISLIVALASGAFGPNG